MRFYHLRECLSISFVSMVFVVFFLVRHFLLVMKWNERIIVSASSAMRSMEPIGVDVEHTERWANFNWLYAYMHIYLFHIHFSFVQKPLLVLTRNMCSTRRWWWSGGRKKNVVFTQVWAEQIVGFSAQYLFKWRRTLTALSATIYHNKWRKDLSHFEDRM